MRGVNRVMLIGNLGKDPDMQFLEGNIGVAKFSLATTETYKDKSGKLISQTEWHTVVLWRGLAELAQKYLHKGSLVYIEGRLKTRSWEDKEGNKVKPKLTKDEFNKLVEDIQSAKQGTAFINFMRATPESIQKVYNGPETANELQLQAMEAAQRARKATDLEEKQKAVIQASVLSKAANVKQMADYVVNNKNNFQKYKTYLNWFFLDPKVYLKFHFFLQF